MHHKRSEHWVVVQGTARLTVGEQIANWRPNESIYVPMQVKHRIENNHDEALTWSKFSAETI